MRLSIGLVALLVVACRTHTVDDCRPACDAADVEIFSGCVARGTDACEPGNRRCCALEANCLGMLDDQNVVTSRPTCDVVMEEQCWPPCTSDDEATFDACVLDGSSRCSPDDDVCCALEADCLGALGDLVVSADGCCAGPEDCPTGEVCDPMFWTCMAGSSFCGDSTTDAGEECDDGNTTTEVCDYGVTSCDVCASDCTVQPGATSFCGDDVVDDVNGEECEPPGGRTCDASCHTVRPAHCSDGMVSGDETDMDCGGSCPGCAPFQRCRTAADCAVTTPECSSTVDCDPSKFMCLETPSCDDGDVCTSDFCTMGVGCETSPVDADRDGFHAAFVTPVSGGTPVACPGDDCDDLRDWVSPGVMFDLGCSSTDLGFGVDEDCDMRTDEDC